MESGGFIYLVVDICLSAFVVDRHIPWSKAGRANVGAPPCNGPD